MDFAERVVKDRVIAFLVYLGCLFVATLLVAMVSIATYKYTCSHLAYCFDLGLVGYGSEGAPLTEPLERTRPAQPGGP